MSAQLRFDGKVVVITGAGQGLGRSHALSFASRGARVLVNDLGGSAFGDGKSQKAADTVVEEIKAAGGEAAASYDSVEDGDKIIQAALDSFGRVDVVINNAGILRDTTFHKMTDADWDLIYRVHVNGAYKVTHAAWPHLREQGSGRVLFTTSAAGIYGNFGQANYAMAKLGLVGLMNTLALEGQKRGISVNAIAPVAGSRLTETILPKDILDALKPEYVSSLVLWLSHESCEENGGLFEVGGGFYGKLRWERTAGKTFRVGREVSAETLRASWNEITSFEETTHPKDVMGSMAPLFANVQAGASKGGNDDIDVDAALGYEFPPVTSSYDERDVALYALGVGAGHDPLNDKELQLVYELHQDGMNVLPTYGVIPAINTIIQMAKEGKKAPGQHYGFERILHGEQKTEIVRPLPSHATLVHKAKITEILDKGKNALVTQEINSFDEDGELLIKNRFTAVVRGAGGWGGDRGPSEDRNVPPSRAPDVVVEEKIEPNAALVYRLSGDWNPLHADPNMAAAFGFERPILHGLCTYGRAGRHVVNAFCNGDPRTFKSIEARFADSVFPGDTLVTEMWKESDTRVVFQCKVKERDAVVITRAAVELYSEIPKPAAKKPKAEASAAATTTTTTESAGPKAADIFGAIGAHVKAHPELAQKIATVFQFRLHSPDATWTIDLKTDGGEVLEGGERKADCTLSLSDADWLDMVTGKADPQQLYFGGKLKISGNVMASQKLEFLRQIDPATVKAAMSGSAAPSTTTTTAAATPATATAASSTKSGRAADVIEALKKRIASDKGLVKEVSAVVAVVVTEPDSAFTLDLKSGNGSVAEGTSKGADATLTLKDEDLVELASGASSLERLFQRGLLRVDGDVQVARRLSLFQKLL